MKQLVIARYRYCDVFDALGKDEKLRTNEKCDILVKDRNFPIVECQIPDHLYQSIIDTGFTKTIQVINNSTNLEPLRIIDFQYIEILIGYLGMLGREYIRICDKLEDVRIKYLETDAHDSICHGANKILGFKTEVNKVMKMLELYRDLGFDDQISNSIKFRLSLED